MLLAKLQRLMKPKKTPRHDLMTEEDKTEYLDATTSSAYRSAIGILMNLASDLVGCANTLRGLAQRMSKPTQRAQLDDVETPLLVLFGCKD